MPTYSEPTFHVAMTRPCPSCQAPAGEPCKFGPHANHRNPALAVCEKRALPRDLNAEAVVINQLASSTLNEIEQAKRTITMAEKRLASLAKMRTEASQSVPESRGTQDHSDWTRKMDANRPGGSDWRGS